MPTLLRHGTIERAPSPDAGEVLRLEPHDDPAAVRDRLGGCARVEVRFPRATDGRGYSIARLLRRMGYGGELRAVGDIGRDQIYYLSRCGFDAFLLREGEAPEGAAAALADFSAGYQRAAEAPGA